MGVATMYSIASMYIKTGKFANDGNWHYH
jgi:hypothetical protein